MKNAWAVGFFFFVLVLPAAAITFQGGCMPHWIDIGGETVVAYDNGVVYTNPPGAGIMGKRTLWRDDHGIIKASFSLVGPYRCVSQVNVDATTGEIAKWHKAQAALSDKS